MLLLNSQGSGEYFGETALIDGNERTATVYTSEETFFITI